MSEEKYSAESTRRRRKELLARFEANRAARERFDNSPEGIRWHELLASSIDQFIARHRSWISNRGG